MTPSSYPRTEIVIGEKWIGADKRKTIPVVNPATGEELGQVPCVTMDDLMEAAATAHQAFL